eukprot:GHUV01016744.1.p1 GENE.GHUV01016744.1~~GHUV01016744.1.p1  ORF type:complete len:260 (+),score=54.31 GHUV01016744.1:186-965(+)
MLPFKRPADSCRSLYCHSRPRQEVWTWKLARQQWPDSREHRREQRCGGAAAEEALPPESSSAAPHVPDTLPRIKAVFALSSQADGDCHDRTQYSNTVTAADAQPPTVTQEQQQQQQVSPRPGRMQAAQSFIQRHGVGAFLSYITVSNAVSVFMLSSAWLLFTKTVGMTPLAPGQWPKFLMFYGGAYAMQHITRPLKLAIGLAGTSIGTAAIHKVAQLFGISDTAALVVLLAVEVVLLLSCLGCAALYAQSLALAASSPC